MPSGLAFSTDVYHRNNRKDRNQAAMNNMGMERGRMRKEPDNQSLPSDSLGKATAKINRKTAAAASTFRRGDEDPNDSDSDTEHQFTYLAQDWPEDSIMRLNARLADARALRAASATENCDYLQSPGMTPCFPDDFSQMPTFTWTGWEWRGYCDEPTPLVQPSVESSSNTSASHYEIMTASRDKDHDGNAGGYYRLPADSYAAVLPSIWASRK